MANENLNHRNITALHENNKILHSQLGELRDVVTKLQQTVAHQETVMNQLREQVILSAVNVGRGPTA